jgi:hypothetical protein
MEPQEQPQPNPSVQPVASSESQAKQKKTTRHALSEAQSRRKTAAICVVVALIGSGVGGLSGYILYKNNHPDTGTLNVPIDQGGQTESIQTEAKAVEKSLAAGTILDDYASQAYKILEYACYRQASAKYALTLGKSTVISSGVESDIVSGTYTTPAEIFNENISATKSNLIKINTAFRFYDKLDGQVTAYECSVPADWSEEGLTPTMTYTYDQYIQTYGKLNKGLYFCTDRSTDALNRIPDQYLADNEEKAALTSSSYRRVNGVVVYAVFKSTILKKENSDDLDMSFVKDGDSYQLSFNLDPTVADYYYQVQMKKTGNLSGYPKFTSSKITFVLNSDLTLQKAVYEDAYTVSVSIIDSAATQTLTQYYFRSDTADFASGSKTQTVTIPELADQNFTGLNLWPDDAS